MKTKHLGIGKWTASVIFCLYCLIAVILIGNMVLSSFKTKEDLIHNTFGIPQEITVENYRYILMDDQFGRNIANSIILSTLSLCSLVFFSSMTAYGLARYRFKGREVLEMYFLLGLMFPIQIAILPLFLIMRNLHLLNTYLGMIIIYTANMSLSVFIFTQFFKKLPYELYESAIMDGAKEFNIYLRIMMPISKPVIFTVGIISFMQIWNDFFLPLVFLTSRSLRTVPLAIYDYLSDFLRNWNFVFAAASLTLIPIIIMFFIFSKQIVSGLVAGSIKQ